jgi:hypothetical protein
MTHQTGLFQISDWSLYQLAEWLTWVLYTNSLYGSPDWSLPTLCMTHLTGLYQLFVWFTWLVSTNSQYDSPDWYLPTLYDLPDWSLPTLFMTHLTELYQPSTVYDSPDWSLPTLYMTHLTDIYQLSIWLTWLVSTNSLDDKTLVADDNSLCQVLHQWSFLNFERHLFNRNNLSLAASVQIPNPNFFFIRY